MRAMMTRAWRKTAREGPSAGEEACVRRASCVWAASRSVRGVARGLLFSLHCLSLCCRSRDCLRASRNACAANQPGRRPGTTAAKMCSARHRFAFAVACVCVSSPTAHGPGSGRRRRLLLECAVEGVMPGRWENATLRMPMPALHRLGEAGR